MAHDIRYVPEGGALYEVVTVTLQNRCLLRPSSELNDVFLGVVAYAQRATGMTIVALTVLSTHYHLIVWAEDARQLADFMGLVNGNASKEVGRLHDWSGTLWQSRYQAIRISDEEAAQVARLEYVLAQGCKESLVDRPEEWPGVSGVRAMLYGETLAGHWYDRTAECLAARRKAATGDAKPGPNRFAERLEVELSPLPCWAHLPEEERRQRVAAIVAKIETETAAERQRTGRRSLGRQAILRAHPHQRPAEVERRPRPRVHAATKRVRQQLIAAYATVVQAYREAARRLQSGLRTVCFPPGTFPPAQEFVPFPSATG